jgi:anaerobic magnesium-protoporphyrin IX monomethyl ester cyclase
LKILLLNPPNKGYYYKLGAFYPPLGIAYISSMLKEAGHETKIIDMNIQKFDYKKENYNDYDLVGISVDTVRSNIAYRIAKYIRSKNIKVVLGGPHASAEVSNILENQIADYVIVGEGERSFLNLVENLKQGELYPEIPGVAYIKHDELKVFQNKFIDDLDSVPFPDREGLPLKLYKTKFDGKIATSIITSRGCPFDCEFCSASQFMGIKWRKRSVDNVMEEIKLLVKKLGYKSLIFFDDNFTMDPKRVIKISEEILKNNLKISWWAFSRADEIVGHEDMVEAMSKAGCKMLFVGFESAVDDVLKEYGKKLTSSIAISVSNILKKYKIDLFASFIFGALEDSIESINKTINLAKRLGASIVQFSILTPYPGTRLFNKLKNNLITKNYELFDATNLVFKHPNFSPESLKKIFIRAYYKVYLNPKLLFKRGLPFFWKILTTKHVNEEIIFEG